MGYYGRQTLIKGKPGEDQLRAWTHAASLAFARDKVDEAFIYVVHPSDELSIAEIYVEEGRGLIPGVDATHPVPSSFWGWMDHALLELAFLASKHGFKATYCETTDKDHLYTIIRFSASICGAQVYGDKGTVLMKGRRRCVKLKRAEQLGMRLLSRAAKQEFTDDCYYIIWYLDWFVGWFSDHWREHRGLPPQMFVKDGQRLPAPIGIPAQDFWPRLFPGDS